MPTFPVSYYRNGEHEPFFVDEASSPVLPSVGDGLIWGDGTRYRVVDVWHSSDHHGHLNHGPHVFLQTVEPFSDDDRPARVAPDYFRG